MAQFMLRENLPGLTICLLLLHSGYVLCAPHCGEEWEGVSGKLRVQVETSCALVYFPWAVLAVFWGGLRRSAPCTAAVLKAQKMSRHLDHTELIFPCYWMWLAHRLLKLCAVLSVCSRSYKTFGVKRIILKYCSTVIQVTLKMTVGVNSFHLLECWLTQVTVILYSCS